jgi:hypothetical protein
MKLIALSFFAFSLSFSSFGQSEELSKELPPIKMLPKKGEVKQIYELPSKTDYKVYNSDGKFLTEGNAQFIDYTTYQEGTYFVHFNGKSESFEKTK